MSRHEKAIIFYVQKVAVISVADVVTDSWDAYLHWQRRVGACLRSVYNFSLLT